MRIRSSTGGVEHLFWRTSVNNCFTWTLLGLVSDSHLRSDRFGWYWDHATLRESHNSMLIGTVFTKQKHLHRGVSRNSPRFTGKHLYQSLLFNKVSGLRSATLFKKRLWYGCFPVNFANFLRTPFFHSITGGCFWLNLDNMKEKRHHCKIMHHWVYYGKKVFLKNSQNSQENTRTRVFF